MSTEATVSFPALLSALRVGARILGNQTPGSPVHTRPESLSRAINHQGTCSGLAL